ncbi:ras family-domain-containing protein [Bisporella sp. PMI_857]|nr:ras family-domain-containing protein [Bisporella sp. PMI_857]
MDLEIIDTSGDEKNMSFTIELIGTCQQIVLVYSVSSRDSFLKLQHLHDTLRSYMLSFESLLIVGSKADLDTVNRRVSYYEGSGLARKIGAHFVETSAMSNINVGCVFGARLPYSIAKRVRSYLNYRRQTMLVRT